MAITKFDLCSRAFIKLDANPITSFEENSKESQVAAILYEPTRDEELTTYEWNFCTSNFTLSREVAAPSDPRWQYAFTLPADHLRTIDLFDQGGSSIDYQEEDGRIFASSPIVSLKYIKRVSEAGFPPFFQGALVARLVFEFVEPIRGEDALAQRAWQEYQTKLRSARKSDLQSNPPIQIVNSGTSSWVRAREGGAS